MVFDVDLTMLVGKYRRLAK